MVAPPRLGLVVAGFAAFMVAHAGYAQPASERAALFSDVRTWAYQLQNINAATLARTNYDLLVLDGLSLSLAEVMRLRKKPDGSRRVLLGYMNIGEAEDYRYYWQSAWTRLPPAWLGSENCRWKGDHRVRFWMPPWRDLMFGSARSYLGRIMANGFDGAFLDRVDIHRYWQSENPQATPNMVSFVTELGEWARAQRRDFLVVPQNGEELLAHTAYRAAIDAQAKEDLFFGDRGNDVANTPARQERALDLIMLAKLNARPVFVIEYIKKPENLAFAEAKFKELGFIGYFGPRSLSRLGIGGPEHPEDRNTEPIMDEANDKAGGCK